MDRRSWIKKGLGITVGASIAANLKAEELRYQNLVHPASGRWMVADTLVETKARLNSNENPYGPSEKAKTAIIDGFKDANRYSRYVADALKQKIAKSEGVQTNQIALFAGLSELLNLMGSVTGLQQGEMISAHPTFDLMPAMAKRIGGKWTQVLLNSKYEHDLMAMESAITSNTKLMYICNPGNPCSTMVNTDDLKSFIKRVSPKTRVFVDEAYIDYVPEPEKHSMVSLIKDYPNLFIGKTLSKIHGFAGLRIAYTISSPEFVKEIEKYHSWDFGLSAPAMYGAMATLDDSEFKSYILRKTEENKSYTVDALQKLGYNPLPSFTNFLIFPIQKSGSEFVAAMATKGVALRSWYFDDKNWCRVSIGTMDEMKLFVDAMKGI